MLYGQDEDLYNHQLNENKWDDIRRSIRYEDQPEGTAGREWTYENDQEYRRELKRQGGNGGNGGSGGSGQGDGGEYDGSSSERSDSYRTPPEQQSAPSVFNGLGVIGYILLGAFILLVAFLIYKLFVDAQRDGKKVVTINNFEDQSPTEIPLTELERLLQEALAKGDYRAAVRIYFIFIIRDLAQKNWIRWEKDKTNFQYLREMSGKAEYTDFNRSVSYFEIIWYGKREIDRATFEKIKPDFTRFLDKLGIR